MNTNSTTTFEKERLGQGWEISERHSRRPLQQMIPFDENRAAFVHEKDANDDVAEGLHRPPATPPAVMEDEDRLERRRPETDFVVVVVVVAKSLCEVESYVILEVTHLAVIGIIQFSLFFDPT